MINKIKEYLAYKKNRKIIKRELTKIAATILLAANSALETTDTNEKTE